MQLLFALFFITLAWNSVAARWRSKTFALAFDCSSISPCPDIGVSMISRRSQWLPKRFPKRFRVFRNYIECRNLVESKDRCNPSVLASFLLGRPLDQGPKRIQPRSTNMPCGVKGQLRRVDQIKRIESGVTPKTRQRFRRSRNFTRTGNSDSDFGIDVGGSVPPSQNVLIVDGYNFCHRWPPSNKFILDGDYESARYELLNSLASSDDGNFEISVIFDAYGYFNNDGIDREEDYFGIRVVFSHESADTTIAHEAAEAVAAGYSVKVVTDDNLLGETCESNGAWRSSVELFVLDSLQSRSANLIDDGAVVFDSTARHVSGISYSVDMEIPIAILIQNVTGSSSARISGYYDQQGELYNGKPCWRKRDSFNTWLLWWPSGWKVTDTESKNAGDRRGWMFSDDEGKSLSPTSVVAWSVSDGNTWKPQSVIVEKASPVQPSGGRKRKRRASQKKKTPMKFQSFEELYELTRDMELTRNTRKRKQTTDARRQNLLKRRPSHTSSNSCNSAKENDEENSKPTSQRLRSSRQQGVDHGEPPRRHTAGGPSPKQRSQDEAKIHDKFRREPSVGASPSYKPRNEARTPKEKLRQPSQLKSNSAGNPPLQSRYGRNTNDVLDSRTRGNVVPSGEFIGSSRKGKMGYERRSAINGEIDKSVMYEEFSKLVSRSRGGSLKKIRKFQSVEDLKDSQSQ